METLRTIVESIIIIIFITALLEIVLPNNDMKRYLNLIIGLFIIVAVLNPFLGLMHKDFSFDVLKDGSELAGEDTQTLINKGREMAGRQKSQAAASYKEKLSRQIMALSGLYVGHDLAGVTIEMVEDPEDPNFGQVNKVVLKTQAVSGAGEGSSERSGDPVVSEIQVEQIGPDIAEIGADRAGQSESTSGDSGSPDLAGLQAMVADFYGLAPEQVEIQK